MVMNQGMGLCWILLGLSLSLVSSLVLVNESNLCEECDCQDAEVKCVFSSGKSRAVTFSDVNKPGWKVSLLGHSHVEIKLKNVACKALSLSGFLSVLLEPGTAFPNSTAIDNVGNVELKSKSSSGIMQVENATRVSLEERAFFNLKEFIVMNVSDALLLEAEALKSRGSSFSPPESRIVFHSVHQIPRIPHNAFSLCRSVLISQSNVTHIQEFAFGGISIHNVTFVDCRIRRLERHAFPDMTLIRHLHFLRCELTSLSQESITSAISSLTFEGSSVTSIASKAFQVLAAAQVRFLRNHFPLKSLSLVFKTWSLMEFTENDFEFLENEAFLGISHPAEEKSRFIFSNNRIRYANRGALRFNEFTNTTALEFQGNAFDQMCECFYPSWLVNVVGEESLSAVFLNSSSCRLSERDISCRSFSSGSTAILSYLEEACDATISEEDPCNNPWILLRERFRPDRDQGILLILLSAASLFSVVLILYSLLRWIHFLLSPNKEKSSKEEEWNFTQIEPLKPPETPSSGMNHYDTPREPLVSPDDTKEEEEDLKSSSGVANNHRKSNIMTGPTLTFYDEMIGFIKEKLDDPENYATVSDNATGDEYADPFDGKELSSGGSTTYMRP